VPKQKPPRNLSQFSDFLFFFFFAGQAARAFLCSANCYCTIFGFGGIQCNSHKLADRQRTQNGKKIRNTHKMRLIVALSAVAHNTLFLLIFCHLCRFLNAFFTGAPDSDNRELPWQKEDG